MLYLYALFYNCTKKITHTTFEVYFNHSTASMHFETKLLLSHLDTHKNNKICGHLGRSHHPFPSTKIISLNITTNALSSSSIAHKTIFRRRFSESHTSITLLRRSDTLLLYQICGREGGKPDLLSHTHRILLTYMFCVLSSQPENVACFL